MTARYAAMLRGIAPAFPNMTNDKLRGVFEDLGLEDVSSVLSSGNILFRTSGQDVTALEDRVQQALSTHLGIPGLTIVRELCELSALVDSDPFRGLTHGPESYLTVTFLKRPAHDPVALPAPSGNTIRSVRYDAAARAFLAVVDNTDPARASRYLTWLERTHGTDVTTRSWLTVRRIVDRLGRADRPEPPASPSPDVFR
jgi:uncharacterized protein (DUF1697 family)